MMRSLARDNRGQELVEYALTLPLLLLMVLGIMEFGVAIFAYNSVANAAREGARVGAVAVGHEIEQDIITAVVERTGGLALSEENIEVSPLEGIQAGDPISITVSYTHTLITGHFLQAAGSDAQLALSSQASMRRESPVPQQSEEN